MKLKVALLLGMLVHATAFAQAYPSKPVRILVGFAAGASTDQLARVIAARLSPSLGQPVVVENRAGAGGTIAADAVAKSAPDGYTLLLGEPGGMAVAPSMMKSLTYDPVKDFAAIGQVISITFLIVAHPSLGAKSLKDLRKDKPLPYGSAGTGTMQHLAVELLKRNSGLPFEHVAYKGGAPALNDLLGGQIPLLVITAGTILPHVKAGKAKCLILTSAEGNSALPEASGLSGLGIGSEETVLWWGLIAPKGVPADRLAVITKAFTEAANTARFKEVMAQQGAVHALKDAPTMDKTIRSELAALGEVAKAIGLEKKAN